MAVPDVPESGYPEIPRPLDIKLHPQEHAGQPPERYRRRLDSPEPTGHRQGDQKVRIYGEEKIPPAVREEEQLHICPKPLRGQSVSGPLWAYKALKP